MRKANVNPTLIGPLKLANAGVLTHRRLRSKMPKKNLNGEIVTAKSCGEKGGQTKKKKLSYFIGVF